VRVTDNGTPNMSDTTSFAVVVNEVNSRPVLQPVSNQVAYVRTWLAVTNVASDADLPKNRLTFTLEPGAPAGARVNRNTGVFTWTPTRQQAPSSNTITVIVTDDGVPPLSATNQFVVVVADYFELSLGSAVMSAGQSTNVSVDIMTSTRVTNVDFVLNAPASRLTSLDLELEPSLNLSLLMQPVTPDNTRFTVQALSGNFLAATQHIGQLNFTAVPNQQSAFVPLLISSLMATQPSGQPVPKTLADHGRAVVVGQELLLEPILSSNQLCNLVLYGQPGTNYRIETSPEPNGPVWTPAWQGTLSNLFLTINGIATTNQTLFFRARQLP
jgi:hypothetical protein